MHILSVQSQRSLQKDMAQSYRWSKSLDLALKSLSFPQEELFQKEKRLRSTSVHLWLWEHVLSFSVFFLYRFLQSCSSPQIRRPPPLFYDKNYRLTSQSQTQCAPKYTHIHSNTLRISFIKVNTMHFQVGDNDTSPTEHQRHERELIHKNLPSSYRRQDNEKRRFCREKTNLGYS